MANQIHSSVSRLIYELSKLPGVGEKTATRLAYFILKQENGFASQLAQAILNAKEHTALCEVCFNFTDQSPCSICKDPARNPDSICVVEKPSDVPLIEQTGNFKGLYHVLHGVLSPLDGVGPEEIKAKQLFKRLESLSVTEIIFALNPSIEGEATSLYLARLLKPLSIKVTRLAHGLPVGGVLEFTDRQTIGKALQNRMEIHS